MNGETMFSVPIPDVPLWALKKSPINLKRVRGLYSFFLRGFGSGNLEFASRTLSVMGVRTTGNEEHLQLKHEQIVKINRVVRGRSVKSQ